MSSPTTAISILGTLHMPTSDPSNGSTPPQFPLHSSNRPCSDYRFPFQLPAINYGNGPTPHSNTSTPVSILEALRSPTTRSGSSDPAKPGDRAPGALSPPTPVSIMGIVLSSPTHAGNAHKCRVLLIPGYTPLFPPLPGNFVPPPIPAIPVPAMAPTPGTAPYAPAPHSCSPSPSNSVPPTHSRNSSARNGTQPRNRTLPTRSPFLRPIPVVRIPRTGKGNLPQLFTDPLVLLSQPVALTLQ
ncbi:hypothetical protein DXG01_014769 [Tephrocybe rancida]|nr:hypothetical protein DXG01_014769 [Tephrocybe rancida]